MRGYGIRLFFFFQSADQVAECFGDRATRFLDNIGLQLYFGTNAFESAEAISKRCGDTTILIESRHRRMTQPMLDLKRLYWNCHPFRSGPRKEASPYRALGLDLPTFDFWSLLQTDPGVLTQRLSTVRNEL